MLRKRWRLWKFDVHSGLRMTPGPSEKLHSFWSYRGANTERLRLNAACRSALLPYRFGIERRP